MKKIKELFDKLMMWMFFSEYQPTVDAIHNELKKETEEIKDEVNASVEPEIAKTEEPDDQEPIGYQITDYDGKSQVYSQRHVFKTFLNAMDFADNNGFLCGFEVRPVFAKDITNPIYIDSSLCR